MISHKDDKSERRRNAFAALAQRALDREAKAEQGEAVPQTRTLADLQPGECADIRALVTTQQARLRLMEMGLTPGAHVRVVRAAAFGGPLLVQVRGYQLSLRREEAASILMVEK